MKTSLWLSVDPLATYNPTFEDEFYFDGQHNGGVYNSGNLAPYIYCYQNPIMYFDPNGKQSKFWTRTFGALQMVGGTVEAIVGGVGGVVTAETGVGAVIGYAVLMNGIDNAVTGANQLWTGENQSTMLHKGVKATAEYAGASENTADNISTGADIATIALGGVNSVNTLSKAPKVAKEVQSVSKVAEKGGFSSFNSFKATHRFSRNGKCLASYRGTGGQ